MSGQTNRLLTGLTAALISAVLVIAPVALVFGGLTQTLGQWQKVGFYLLSIIGGGVSGALGFQLSPGEKELTRQRVVVWAGFVFVFLYVASAALCEHIKVSIISWGLWSTLGFILFSLGLGLRIWAIAILGPFHSAFVARQPGHTIVTRGPYRWLRHPSYLGLIIALIGIPMIFGTWFSLMAIPGVIVAIKWRLKDEEAFLVSEFGEEYENYKKTTWRLFPKLY